MARLLSIPYIVIAIFCLAQSAQADEAIHLGVSDEVISITSNFNGTELIVFGSVESLLSDPPSKTYDVVVVLQGPDEEIIVRQKERIIGIWVNSGSKALNEVPASYSIATTRPVDEIADDSVFAEQGLGITHIDISPGERTDDAASPEDEYSRAFFRLKNQKGLYVERTGGIRFLSSALFKARLAIPANVPVGTHTLTGYAFSDGRLKSIAKVDVKVEKSGFEAYTYQMSRENGLIFGLITVLLAMLAGWLASVIFRKK